MAPFLVGKPNGCVIGGAAVGQPVSTSGGFYGIEFNAECLPDIVHTDLVYAICITAQS